jgi:hypothetical protein
LLWHIKLIFPAGVVYQANITSGPGLRPVFPAGMVYQANIPSWCGVPGQYSQLVWCTRPVLPTGVVCISGQYFSSCGFSGMYVPKWCSVADQYSQQAAFSIIYKSTHGLVTKNWLERIWIKDLLNCFCHMCNRSIQNISRNTCARNYSYIWRTIMPGHMSATPYARDCRPKGQCVSCSLHFWDCALGCSDFNFFSYF